MSSMRDALIKMGLVRPRRSGPDAAPAAPQYVPVALGLTLGVACAVAVLVALGVNLDVEWWLAATFIGAIGAVVGTAIGRRRSS